MKNLLVFFITVLGLFAMTANAQAPCFTVADEGPAGGIGSGATIPDTLYSVTPAGVATEIGDTGTLDIESIAYNAQTAVLYAMNGGTLITLDYNLNGAATTVGASGFTDIDGLTFDYTVNPPVLYGTQRNGGGVPDQLVTIDTATGVATLIGDIGVTATEDNIDDIAIDCQTGVMYGILNNSDNTTTDKLVTINKLSGAITVVADTGVFDMEGLSFAPDGTLIASTGNNGGNNGGGGAATSNSFFDLGVPGQAGFGTATGQRAVVDATGAAIGEDFESLACFVPPPAVSIQLQVPPPESDCVCAGGASNIVTVILVSGSVGLENVTITTDQGCTFTPGNVAANTQLVFQCNVAVGQTITATASASDCYGRSDSDTDTATVLGGSVDNTPPTLTGVPANLELDCADPIPVAPTVIGDDDCEVVTTVVTNFIEGEIPGNEICFLVADENNTPNAPGAGDTINDTLYAYDRVSGNAVTVGDTGTTDIEAIAFDPTTGILYAFDGGNLVTLDYNNGGTATTVGAAGSGGGPLGNVVFDDLDGMSFDASVNPPVLYATQRVPGAGNPDLLVRIDPATGAIIPGSFGGDDYLVLGALNGLENVDDIAFDPNTGVLYAIYNDDDNATGDELATINLLSGTPTLVTNTGVFDMEGISFDSNGELFGSTGNNGDAPATANSVYDLGVPGQAGFGTAANQNRVAEADGTVIGYDFEALACYVPVEFVQIPTVTVVTVTNPVVVTLTATTNAFPANCPGTIERVWTATDACGNVSAATQSIIIVDDTPPVVNCPADIVLLGNADCEAPLPNLAATATDNCASGAELVITQTPPAGTLVTDGTMVTITAVDSCGNTNTIPCVVDVTVDCFDLALTKVLASAPPFQSGDDVTFTINVFNQGSIDATSINLIDYIPAGLILNDSDWTLAGSTATLNTPIPLIAAGDAEAVDITFTIAPGVTGALTNVAEISAATGGTDIDSTPDGSNTDTIGGDNVTDNTNGDEDDHDPAVITVDNFFDLALIKVLSSVGPFVGGDTVTFTITVTNQGTLAATNIELADYIPAGLTLADAAWTAAGSTATLNTPIPGPLAPGGSTAVTIDFTIDSGVSGTLTNVAEIAGAVGGTDIDSVPDATDGDTIGADNVTDNTNGDEDDHDPAPVTIAVDPVSIGSTVFFDPNDNGIQDAGDAGIPGVTVQLFNAGDDPLVDAPLASVQTSGNGDYFFGGLAPGDYFVYIPTPPTSATQSSTPTDTADNQQDGDDNGIQAADGAPVQSPVITLTPNTEPTDATETFQGNLQDAADDNNGDMTVDFGFVPKVSIGSTVFYDFDDNGGQFPPTEPGIPGVVVELLDAAGTVIGVDTTDINGVYFFGDLLEGNYQVRIPVPPSDAPTSSTNTDLADNNQDGDDNGDQPGGPGTAAISPVINLMVGQEPVGGAEIFNPGGSQDDAEDASGDMTVDFGFFARFDLALTKVLDDMGPYSSGDDVTFIITVTNQGDMAADNINVVDYIPAGLTLNDATWTQINGTTAVLNSPLGPLAPGGSIAVPVTFTINSGVSGSLTNIAEISSATDANGAPQTDEDSVPDQSNTDPIGGDNVTDNTNGDEDDHDPAEVLVDETPVSIGSTVFYDPNNNGLQDAGETGISGVLVELYDAANTPGVDTPISSVPTNADGDYFFGQLVPGDYIVYIPTPPVDAPGSSTPTSTFDDQTDGDDNGTQAAEGDPTVSPVITLADNAEPTDATETFQGNLQDATDDNNGDMTVDFGFVPKVSIGSTVFFDLDDSGVQEAGETGIPGALVELLQGGVVIASTNTDSNGDYFFGDLMEGTYQVQVTPIAAAPRSSTPTSTADDDVDGNDDGTQATVGGVAISPMIVLTHDGEVTNAAETFQGNTQDDADDNNGNMTVDFGFFAVFDLALTKVLDSAGPFVPGDDVTFVITVTNQGDIAADNINVIDYVPAGLTLNDAAWTGAGSSATLNSPLGPLGPAMAIRVPITFTIDAGVSGSLTNIAEISSATDAFNMLQTDIDSVPDTTNTDPIGGDNVTDNSNGDEDDHDPAEILVNETPVSIGSTVFYDPNNNGFQDAGETGIPGVLVELYDAADTPGVDTPISSVPTNADGDYFFGQLVPGDYIVYIPTPPADAPGSSTPTSTFDDQTDGDDNGTQAAEGDPTVSPVITLADNAEPTDVTETFQGNLQDATDDNNGDMTVDFGFVPKVSIGSTVFLDADDSGTQDTGEPGIAGVLVELLEAGVVIASTNTDVNGDYFFGDLFEGTYQVQVTPDPAAPRSSTPTSTSDDDVDENDDGTQTTVGAPALSPMIMLTHDGETSNEPGQGGMQDDADDNNGNMTVDFGFVRIFDLALAKDLVTLGPFVAGQDVTFTITVTNEGDIVASSIGLSDTIPAGLILNDAAWTDNGGVADLNSPLGPLAPGATTSADITFTIADGFVGALTNVAQISEATDENGDPADDVDSTPGNDDPAEDDQDDAPLEVISTPVSIGSTVFFDPNDSGTQDAGEAGIPGVLVELYDAADTPGVDTPLTSMPTDTDGNYFFGNLTPGDYIVYIPVPPSSATDSSTPTSTADNNVDGDDNGTQANDGDPVISPVITLADNAEPTDVTETFQGNLQDATDDNNGDMTVDFGFVPKVSIGSTVFYDFDDNGGQFPPTEPGIPGVVVELLDAAGTVIGVDTTDVNGVYFFGDLLEGNYQVRVPVPPSDAPTSSTNTDTADNGQDGDENGIQIGGPGTSTISPVINLMVGQEVFGAGEAFIPGGEQDDANDANGDMTIDFGFFASFDLALTKVLDDQGPYAPGDMVTFIITVTNQGDVVADNISIVDYLPAGLTLTDAAWSQINGSTAVLNAPLGPLAPGASTTVPVSFTIDAGVQGVVTNVAEISSATDANGAPATDFDSTPDLLNTDPIGGDNVTDNSNGDEDDHDPAEVLVDETPVSIGSTVFYDPNNNGFQDAGETGIPGILVELYDAADTPGVDTPISSVPTNADGDYFFGQLVPGDYIVYIPTPPADAPGSSTPTSTADDQTDGDDNGTQAAEGDPTVSPVITLADNAEPIDATETFQGNLQDATDDNNGDMTVDFGFVPKVSIGSTVFLDADDSGTQDTGEPGIAGVLVELLEAGVVIASTNTDVNGDYFFGDLFEGTYQVQVTPDPAAPRSSTPTSTSDDDVDENDDGTQATVGAPALSPMIMLTHDGETSNEPGQGGTQDDADDNNGNMTVDFGFVRIFDLALAKDLVTPGPFVAGQDVTFTITVTNEGDIVASSIGLSDTIPAGLILNDAGWTDNGGVADLNSPLGPLAAGATTSADITFTIADGFVGALTNVAQISEATDENGDPADDVDSTPGNDDPAEDDQDDAPLEVIATPVSIGSTVFYDIDDSGTQDVGEAGIPGVDVELYDAADTPGVDTPLASMPTNGDGDYFFGNLSPGDYIVYIPVPPADAPTSSDPTSTADDQTDEDDNGTQAAAGDPTVSPVITLADNTEPIGEPGQGGMQDGADDDNGDMTVDFGFVPKVSIGSTVFLDADDSGIQEAGEAGIAGVLVELLEAGVVIASTNTDSNGDYFFGGLMQGTYQVQVTPDPAAPRSSTFSATADDDVDSNDDGTQATVGAPALSPMIMLTHDGETSNEPGQGGTQDDADDDNGNMTVDFGFVRIFDLALVKTEATGGPFAPGGTVTYTITVTNQGDITASTVALADYIPTGLTLADAAWTANGGIAVLNTPIGPIAPGASIDTPITFTIDAGVSGDLINFAEIIATTDENGAPNSTEDADSAPDLVNNDTVGGDNVTDGTNGDEDDHDPETITVQDDPVSIGSTVFYDIDDSSTQDAGEGGISNVVVQLFAAAAPPGVGAPIANTTTDSNGDYFFGNLAPGAYVVYIPTPPADAPESSTGPVGAGNDGIDSDDNGLQILGSGAPVQSLVIVLSDNGEPVGELGQGGTQDAGDDDNGDMTVDFGFIPTVSIGSTVFFDADDSGVQEAGEPGISNVVVLLLDASSNILANTTTDANGDYFFGGLNAGDYIVAIPSPPADAPRSSTPTSTSDDNIDLDDNGDQPAGVGSIVYSPVITLSHDGEPTGEANTGGAQDAADDNNGDMTVDFGFIRVFDLALIKVLDDQGPYVPGDAVTFDIIVTNQGDITATTINLIDYIPTGLILNDALWAQSGSTATRTIGPLAAGATDTVSITFLIDSLVFGPLTNVAEIAATTDENGAPNSSEDADSTPDSTDGDPIGGDNLTDSSNGDEDDHDPAEVVSEFTPVSVGSAVFYDPNNNGVQDPGEAGIPGVPVELYSSAGVLVSNLVTDASGLYHFTGLVPGDYYISIPTPPANAQMSSTPTSTVDDDIDGDDNGIQAVVGGVVTSAVFTLTHLGETSNETFPGGTQDDALVDASGNMTIDFGFVQIFDLALIKTVASPGPFVPLDDVTFTITVTNQGTIAAQNIVINDYIPAGLVLNDAAWTANAGIANNNSPLGPIAPGASTSIDITFTIIGIDPIINIAEIASAEDGNGNPGNDQDSTPDNDPADDPVTDDVTDGTNGDEDDHDIAEIVPEFVAVGDTIFDDTNNNGVVDPGEASIAGVAVTLLADLDGDGAFTDVVGTAVTDSNGLYLFDGLGPRDYVLQVDAANFAAGGPLEGLQSSTGNGTAPDPDDDVEDDDNGEPDAAGNVVSLPVTLTLDGEPVPDADPIVLLSDDDNRNSTVDFGFFAPNPDLALIKTVDPGPYTAGDPVTFTITVFNQGNVPMTNISVVDYVPAGLTLADGAWSQSGTTATINAPIAGPIDPGMSTTVTISFTVAAGASGSIENIAEIESAEDPDGNNTDSDSTPDNTPGDTIGGDDTIANENGDEDDHDPASIEVDTFDLALIKVPQNIGTVMAGEPVAYLITVTNQGNVVASGIELIDYFPAGLALYDAAWTDNGNNTATYNSLIGPLAPGATATVSIGFLADGTVAGSITNVAEIAAANDPAGPASDIDSTPDTSNTDPVGGDNVTDNSNGDEDDHDFASTFIALEPGISITKTVAPSNCVCVADQVTYSIIVSNLGDVALVDVAVSDALVPACNMSIGPMAVGDVVTYICVGTAQFDLMNTAIVNGESANGVAVQDANMATYTVDSTPPTWVGALPVGGQIPCDQNPAPASLTATDACDNDVAVTVIALLPSGTDCNETFGYRYTATDDCGNEIVYDQVFSRLDNVDPVLAGVPGPLVLECGDPLPAPATVTGTDNCSDAPVSYRQQPGPVNCAGQGVIRTWTARDACGNTVSASQTITFQDSVNPTLTGVPPNAVVPCNQQLPPAPMVTGNDNCTAPNVTMNQIFGPITCAGQGVIRTWTVTDACGNSASASQIITLSDDAPPTFNGTPANFDWPCDQPLPAAPIVTANDDCSTAAVTLNVLPGPGTCAGQGVIREWTATDECGNDATLRQTITLIDATDPVLVGVPADLFIECDDDLPPAAPVGATDTCDDNPVVTLSESTEPGNCAGPVVVRTWTARDACGNESMAIQRISRRDTGLPSLVGVPADETVECGGVIPAPPTVTGSDDCGDVAVVLETRDGPITCAGVGLLRIWTGTDECGNTVTDMQTITLEDTTDPVISGVPADATVECGQSFPTPATLTATDSCDNSVAVTSTDMPGPANCAGASIIRTWTATDDCGNSATVEQTITVLDSTDPVIVNGPADVTVDCSSIPVAPTLSATDICGDATVTLAETPGPVTCAGVGIIRTWTATDTCGNDAVHVQTITLEDTTDPVLVGVPADASIECDAPMPPVTTVGATDDCDDAPAVTLVESTEPGGCAGPTVVRTWTATDACGNDSVAVQRITRADSGAPTLSGVPTDATIECGDPLPAAPTVTGSDDCSTVTVVFEATDGPTNCAGTSVVRTWVGTDECGNAVTNLQTITLIDTTGPVLVGVPADMTVDCSDPFPAPATVTATDACDNNVTVTSADRPGPTNCGRPGLIRTWTAMDACGNTATAEQTITVVDTTDPVIIGGPADITVDCSSIPAPVVVTATDDCGQATVAFTEAPGPVTCAGQGLVRTWTATDACGNDAVHTQTITLEDTTDPVLNGVPSDVTLSCTDAIPGATVTATDDCSTPSLVPTETETPGSCQGERTIVRTWTATDACGNEVVANQTITITDEVAPSVAVSPTIVLDGGANCDAIVPDVVLSSADNCSSAGNITISQTPAAGTVITDDVTVTVTVTDDCGNATTSETPVRVVCDAPAILIEKTVTEGTVGAAGCPGVESFTATTGTPITWCLKVSNIGPVVLNNVVITDPILGIAPISVGTMPVGDMQIFVVPGTITGDIDNIAFVTGDGPDGTTVTDDDPADVDETPLGSIGDTVFIDAVDDNSTFDPTADTPIAGVTVNLTGTDNQGTPVSASTVTDGNGAYFFTNLVAGIYLVTVDSSTLPANLVGGETFDFDGSDDSQSTYSLAAGEHNRDQDFGYMEMFEPDITLEKTVYLGHDAGASCEGTELVVSPAGSDVTYCFKVINTGDTHLSNIMVTDTDIGFSTVIPGPLAPGAMQTVHADATLAADLVNTAGVNGNPTDSAGNDLPGQPDVGDMDDAEVRTGTDPAVRLEKTVYVGHNGGASCPGSELVQDAPGTAITYCFEVINIGGTHLSNLIVTDMDIGFTDTIAGPLAPGASAFVHVDETLGAALVNTADVAGNPTDAAGNDIPGLVDVTDDDTAEVEPVVMPGITLEKTVYLGHNDGATCEGAELVVSPAGSQVTYCFKVTNTGDTHLSNILVSDPDIGFSTTIAGPLAPGAMTTVFAEEAIAAALINTADVTGNPTDSAGNDIPGAPDVTDDDTAEVRPGTDPGVSIEKTVYAGHDGGASCEGGELVQGPVGSDVTYCFKVTNTGGTYLGNIIVTDTDIGYSVTIPGPLAPGASVVEFAENSLAAELLNTASVTGTPTDMGGTPIPGLSMPTDDDTAKVEPVNPSINLQKTVYAGHDGGAGCPGTEVALVTNIDAVTFCFRVENTGDTPLSSVVVTDTDISPAAMIAVPNLPVGGVQFVFVERTSGALTNVAKVAGAPSDSSFAPIPGAPMVMNTDDARVISVDEPPAIVGFGSIGDRVFEDIDENGLQDPGEPGIVGISVELFSNGTNVGSTVTDSNGEYLFDNLPIGQDYTVVFGVGTLPNGFSVTLQDAGNDDRDSDGNPSTGFTTPVSLTTDGQNIPNIDLGIIIERAGLGDTVWEDLNGDGNPNNENLANLGIVGATVNLYAVNPDGTESFVATTLTSANGTYQFLDLAPGNYRVAIDRNTIPAQLSLDSTPLEYTINLSAGQYFPDADFGFLGQATAVTLESFSATVAGNTVSLDWLTAYEENSLGYYVYRDGQRVNDGLILSANSGGGAAYSLQDSVAEGIYTYTLEELDNDLGRAVIGEVTVAVGGGEGLAIADQGIYSIAADANNTDVVIDGQVVDSIAVEGGLIFYVSAGGANVKTLTTDEPHRMQSAAGTPVAGNGQTVELVDGEAAFQNEGVNTLVFPFTGTAVILDVSDAAHPVVLDGEAVPGTSGDAVYFSAPVGIKVHAADLK